MSDLELEKAALGPRRWIELCGAFEKEHLNDLQVGTTLYPPATRVIDFSLIPKVKICSPRLFLVPGG